jgi:hypothetical protein
MTSDVPISLEASVCSKLGTSTHAFSGSSTKYLLALCSSARLARKFGKIKVS